MEHCAETLEMLSKQHSAHESIGDEEDHESEAETGELHACLAHRRRQEEDVTIKAEQAEELHIGHEDDNADDDIDTLVIIGERLVVGVFLWKQEVMCQSEGIICI